MNRPADLASPPRDILLDLFHTAVQAASGQNIVVHLPPAPAGRVIVLGAGKASAAMAEAVEQAWPDVQLSGLVVIPYGHGADCRRIEVIEAGHPVPDEAGLAAADRMLALARGTTADDLVLALISGGGSSLLVKPAAGLTLADKQAVTRQLLASGAAIHEINGVRRRLSAIKGGRLALAASPATVLTYVVSDVPGDDPALVASGPTLPDASDPREALATLDRYRIAIPPAVRRHLRTAPAITDSSAAAAHVTVVARPRTSLDAAAARAAALGLEPIVLGDDIEGEAREVATAMAAAVKARGRDLGHAPCVFLSGGETSVTLQGSGRGGRNTEFLLALTIALGATAGFSAIACDTDGIDGSGDNAGAVAASDTLARAEAMGLDARRFLRGNDSYTFFEALGDLVFTGPTRTNVNDFRAILLAPRS